MAHAPLLFAVLSLAAPTLQGPSGETIQTSPEGELEPIVRVFPTLHRIGELPLETPLQPSAALALSPTVDFLSVDAPPEGDMPRELAFMPDGSEVLICNRDTNTVTFFNLWTSMITDTVEVGVFPMDIAILPDGQHAVVPNAFSNTVSVIDIPSRTVLAEIPITGSQPYRVEVCSSNDDLVAVGVIDDAVTTYSAVSIIDVSTLTEVASIPTVSQGAFGAFFTPEVGIFGNITTQLRLTPDGSTLLLVDRASATAVLYDVATGALAASLSIPTFPTSIDISEDGTLAVVGHEFNVRKLTVIDLVTQTVQGSYDTGADLFWQSVRITKDKSHAIASQLNEVCFINLATGALDATISTGSPGDIELTYDGAYAVVSNYNTRVIDLSTLTVVKTLTHASTSEAAASPVSHHLVGLNNRFREDVHLYDTSGPTAAFISSTPSGELLEHDAPRTIAVSPAGDVMVAVNSISQEVVIIDVATETIRSSVHIGERPMDVAITPDGAHAVVCVMDEDRVAVIDLSTDALVASIPLGTRPAEVVISSDSQWAYVTTVAGTDKVHKIQLAGASSAVIGSLVTGQMGSISYSYTVTSGLSISPDDSLLAICISFDDELMLVDTSTFTEIGRVTCGDFPVRAAFTPDSAQVVVANSFSDSVDFIDVTTVPPSLTGSLPSPDLPLLVIPDPDSAHVYVGSFGGGTASSFWIYDTAPAAMAGTVPLPSHPRAAAFSSVDGLLYAACDGAHLAVVDLDGASSVLLDQQTISGSPADLVFSEAYRTAYCAQPGRYDGLDVVRMDLVESYCATSPNTVGVGAVLSSSGSTSHSQNAFQLSVSGAVPNQFGLFYYGRSQISVPFGNGTRCVGGGGIGVFRLSPPATCDAAGDLTRALDLTQSPASAGPGRIDPGTAWNFQFWYRDPSASPSTFNLSDALRVHFTP